ncbi:MAG TPA: methylated-DNA--[protein]-cysteine S-methyltransferase [Bacillota bacterium]|nr:methylated-DNA--[protein]-cysteine S-methyltransferase [Bacillota bacterium]
MQKTEFSNCVYEIVAQIPTGKVMTYGQIGMILGSPFYARRVGQAMYNAPEHLDLPCYRVINSKGELAPAHVFGSVERQREILLGEGVSFKPNGCVDLKKSLWLDYEIRLE